MNIIFKKIKDQARSYQCLHISGVQEPKFCKRILWLNTVLHASMWFYKCMCMCLSIFACACMSMLFPYCYGLPDYHIHIHVYILYYMYMYCLILGLLHHSEPFFMVLWYRTLVHVEMLIWAVHLLWKKHYLIIYCILIKKRKPVHKLEN